MPMKLITVHLPEKFLDALDKLVEEGKYPNRSEIIRMAIRDFLLKEFEDLKNLKLKKIGIE